MHTANSEYIQEPGKHFQHAFRYLNTHTHVHSQKYIFAHIQKSLCLPQSGSLHYSPIYCIITALLHLSVKVTKILLKRGKARLGSGLHCSDFSEKTLFCKAGTQISILSRRVCALDIWSPLLTPLKLQADEPGLQGCNFLMFLVPR